jgi:flagellar protein FlgJ
MDSMPTAQWAITPFDWSAPESLTGKKADDPQTCKSMAQQFEALLIGQMLRTMREAGGTGWLGDSGSESDAGLTELAEQQLALAIASGGGLGLAALAEKALAADHGEKSNADRTKLLGGESIPVSHRR